MYSYQITALESNLSNDLALLEIDFFDAVSLQRQIDPACMFSNIVQSELQRNWYLT